MNELAAMKSRCSDVFIDKLSAWKNSKWYGMRLINFSPKYKTVFTPG